MREIGTNPITERTIYLVDTQDLAAFASDLQIDSRFFNLFLVCDASDLSGGVIAKAAEELVKAGLVYLCAWGPDCERVHDIFDEVIVGPNPEETSLDNIMTTWHSSDSLDEALWFFLHCAIPDDCYFDETKAEVVAVIGNDAWSNHLQRRLKEQDKFNEEMLST